MELQETLLERVEECKRESPEVVVEEIVDDDPTARDPDHDERGIRPVQQRTYWIPTEDEIDWLTGEYTMKGRRGNNSFWW